MSKTQETKSKLVTPLTATTERVLWTRLPAQENEYLEILAARDERKLNDYVRSLIRKAAREAGLIEQTTTTPV